MATLVIVVGLLTLAGLAVLIGVLDGRAKRQAWNRIARERRKLGECRRGLLRAAETDECAACRLLEERSEDDDPR